MWDKVRKRVDKHNRHIKLFVRSHCCGRCDRALVQLGTFHKLFTPVVTERKLVTPNDKYRGE